MLVYDVFVLMFDALDVMYDEAPNEILGNYLSGLNPFWFNDEGSADPAEYEEFKEVFLKQFSNKEPSPEETYIFCKDYLKLKAPKEVNVAFSKINKDDWIYSAENNEE
ncbi:MAG: hypothetical protein IJN40_07485 [Clostridia bacterium]|nr:hypothetical protein [Clostridia bacterium]